MDRETLAAMVWAATFSREVGITTGPTRKKVADNAAWIAAQTLATFDTLPDSALPITPKPAETAREIAIKAVKACEGLVFPHTPATLISKLSVEIATALRRAHTRGQREGIERAAKWHDDLEQVYSAHGDNPQMTKTERTRFYREADVHKQSAAAIRALSIEDEKP